ncbi:hypothetical protein GCM10027564_26750 [Luteimonas notoginsengisoli]
MAILHTSQHHEPWNKGKLIGQKAPLKLKDIWGIRIRLQLGDLPPVAVPTITGRARG